MKRLATLLVSMTLAIPAPLAVPTPAVGEPNNGVVDECRGVIQLVPELTLGECIALVRTDNTQGYGPHRCKLFLQQDPELFYDRWDSFMECVKDWQD